MKPKKMNSLLVAASVSMGVLLSSTAAVSDTLSDALIWAYQSSPTLEINRANLRSADEGVAQARAAKRPQLDASANISLNQATGAARNITDVYRAQLDASLLLYDGGATNAAIQSANANVQAARASLVGIEQGVLINAVAAYVDVRRDQKFVSLAENNVKVINQQVEAARDRFEVGEVTRTDVSQANARLASARSNLAANRGAYQRSIESYIVAVGRKPNRLAPLPAIPKLPATLSEAQAIAKREHPSIKAGQSAQMAAEFDLVRAKAAKKPRLSLGANVTYSKNAGIYGQDQTSGALSLSGRVPLYDGGANNSLIRQAHAVLDRRKAELQDSGRIVEQDTAIAWANLDVARASIRSSRQQIRAARIAFEGIQEEAKLGARTTLDVLDAEQEVLNAESGLVAAQRDEYLAAYNLIASMGLLTTKYLNLGIEEYDPNVYYQSVNKKPLSAEGEALNRISRRWSN